MICFATSVLEQFVPSTIANSDLSAQVGDELAALIAEAEQDRDGDNIQRLVVHPGPVHRVSSLMDEEADLTAHAEVMSSCLPIVEKLRQTGQITAQEEQKARAYLQLHENPWPSQPEVMDGAVLYLAGAGGYLSAPCWNARKAKSRRSSGDCLIEGDL